MDKWRCPKIMGVLNVTPDSFYDGGCYFGIDVAVAHAEQMVEEGADIIDIGGESTRPKQVYDSISGKPKVCSVSLEEELRRVIPIIEVITKRFPEVPVSIDTVKAEVARQAVTAGASYINDISGFRDDAMRRVAVETGVKICVVHMLGTPDTMQESPHYPNGVVKTLIDWFEEQTKLLIREGIRREQIIIDPGIGFGKTVADNIEILQNLHKLRALGFPVLVGVSRKSFMMKILKKPSEELLSATLSINTLLSIQGVEILRVHDVAAHSDMMRLMEMMHMKKAPQTRD